MTDPQNPAVPPADGSVPPVAPPPAEPPAAAAPPPADPSYASAPPPAAQPYAAAPAAYSTPEPAYTAAPPPAYGPPATASVPGKTLGIVALVVVFFASLIGLILGYVARSQSKKAGVKNTPAKVAIILGWIFIALSIIATIIIIAVAVPIWTEIARACLELGPGTHTLSNGATLTCGAS